MKTSTTTMNFGIRFVLLLLGGGKTYNDNSSVVIAGTVSVACSYIDLHTKLSLYIANPFTFYCFYTIVAATVQTVYSCPAFGTEFDRGHDTSNSGLWLNFATPAQCSGTAVAWRFCYYVQFSDSEHEVWLRLYRKTGIGSYTKTAEDIVTRQYERSEDLTTYGATCDEGNPPFCCEDRMVSHQIEKNDIIGVCMRDSKGHDPLFVLDEGAPANYTLYDFPDTTDCNNRQGQVENFITSDKMSVFNGYGLHARLIIAGIY